MNWPPDNLKNVPELNERALMVAWRGSIAHGMYVPNTDPNSIDDKDIMGVYVDPLDGYFGTKTYHSRGTMEVKEGEWDVVCYELRKFLSLLAKGNPNVISMLWLDQPDYLILTPLGERILTNKWMFESKLIFHSFVGYAHDQMKKMTHCAFKGYMGAKRKSLVEKFGYDTKNAAHLIRLLRMAIEFLETKEFRVKRWDAAELLTIKRGEWELEKVKQTAEGLFKHAHSVFDTCTWLPDEPDYGLINNLSVSIVRDAMGWKI